MSFFKFVKDVAKTVANVAPTVISVIDTVEPILNAVLENSNGEKHIFQELAAPSCCNGNYLGGSARVEMTSGVQVGLVHFNTITELALANLSLQRLRTFVLSVKNVSDTIEIPANPTTEITTAQNQIIWMKGCAEILNEAVGQFRLLFKTQTKNENMIESATQAFLELLKISEAYAADLSLTLLALLINVDYVPVGTDTFTPNALGRSSTWSFTSLQLNVEETKALTTKWNQMLGSTYESSYANSIRKLQYESTQAI